MPNFPYENKVNKTAGISSSGTDENLSTAGQTNKENMDSLFAEKEEKIQELSRRVAQLKEQVAGQRKLLRKESDERIKTRKKLLDAYSELEERVVSRTEDLKKDKHELKHFLENQDADFCMKGKQCVALGIEIAQLLKNIKGDQF